MKKLLLGSVGLMTLVAGPAMAADMPVKTPVYKAPAVYVFNWTGCYIGGNFGWIGGRDRFTNTPSGAFLSAAPEFLAANTTSSEPRGSSITGGGQVGCNYQAGSVVLGVEADINGSGLNESATIVTPAIGQVTSGTAITEFKKLDWFSTFRARAGITPWDRALIYITGGFAVAQVSSAFALVDTGASTYAGSASPTRSGWTIGGGVEWAFANNWSVKAEYLYLDFGTWSYISPNTSNAGGPAAPTFTFATNVRSREQIARIGVNYRFGGPVIGNY
jgi:outer membrane immunogenic protein